MPLYTFYPCLAEGGAPTFETFELSDDRAAEVFAFSVLGRHSSAAYVAIWSGERFIGAQHRPETGPPSPVYSDVAERS